MYFVLFVQVLVCFVQSLMTLMVWFGLVSPFLFVYATAFASVESVRGVLSNFKWIKNK